MFNSKRKLRKGDVIGLWAARGGPILRLMFRPALILLLVSACAADLPPIDSTISHAAQNQPFPTLEPIDALLAEADRPSRAQAAGDALTARGAGLARRSVARPVGGSLAARGERLRRRADELRAINI